MWDMCLDGSVYLPVKPGSQGHGSSRGSDWPREWSVLEEKMSCKSDKWLTFLGAAKYRSWHSAPSQIVNCWARGRPNKILIKHHKKNEKKLNLVNLIPSSPSLPLHLLDIPGLMAVPTPACTPKILCISRQQFKKKKNQNPQKTNHMCPFIHFQKSSPVGV